MALTKITSRILDSSGVTILGTIATGVWQGTAINQTYLVGQSGTNTGDETLARINALDVTELGTISSGVWNGTAINQTYLVGQSGTNTGDETLARINALDVTELGTISSGVWNGTVIASAYLDADTAHLSTTQTFTGAKTFSSNAIFTGNVGIGTASPSQAKLVISPNVAASALDGLTLSYHPDATAAQVRAKLFIDSYHGKLQLTNGSGVVTTHISAGGTDTYFNGSKVGIGTTSPAHKLSVNQNTYASGSDAPEAALGITIGDYWTTTAGAALTIKNAGHRGAVGHASGSPLFRADFNNAVGMILNKDGNVGIGTDSPFGVTSNRIALSVNGTTSSVVNIGTGGTQRGYFYAESNQVLLNTTGALPLHLGTNGSNYLTISSGGNVIISKSDTGYNNEALQIINSGNHEAAIRYDTNHTANKGFTVGAAVTVADAFEITRVASSGAATPYLSVGSSWASNLDAYEEGTWTPILLNANGNESTEGTYTRIGNIVRVGCLIVFGSQSNTTQFTIQAFPFQVGTTNEGTRGGVSVAYSTSSTYYTIIMDNGYSQARAFGQGASGNPTLAQLSGTRVYFGGTYQV